MGLGTTVTLMYWDDEANTLRPISTDFPLPTGQGTSIVLPEGETVDTSNLATSAKQDIQTDQLRSLAAVAEGGAMTVDGSVQVSGSVAITNDVLRVALGADPISVQFPAAQSVTVANEPTVKVAGTVPVSGSVSAVQSGEWTVTPSGTQNVSVTNVAPLKTTVENIPSVTVSNPVTNVSIDGEVTIANPVSTVTVANPVRTVEVSNPVTSVSVTNQPTSIAISNTSIPVTDNGGSLTVDGTVTTVPSGTTNVAGTVTTVPSGTQTVQGTVTTNPSGTQTVAGTVAATQSGTWTFTPSGTQTVTGTVTSNSSVPVLSAASTAMTSFRNAAVTNAAVQVRSGGGRVHQYHFGNPNSTVIFVHLYNALPANVTVGTTVPVSSYMVAANSALDGFWPNSFNYGTGISVAVTTTAAGATAPTNPALVVLGYV